MDEAYIRTSVTPRRPSLVTFRLFYHRVEGGPITPAGRLNGKANDDGMVADGFGTSLLFYPLRFAFRRIPSEGLRRDLLVYLVQEVEGLALALASSRARFWLRVYRGLGIWVVGGGRFAGVCPGM